jgi:hypothetical protein
VSFFTAQEAKAIAGAVRGFRAFRERSRQLKDARATTDAGLADQLPPLVARVAAHA